MTQVYSLILSIIAQVERIETDNEKKLSKKIGMVRKYSHELL